MIWIKLGLLLTGFIFAGLLPHTIRKTLQHINFNPKIQTLSFLSNKGLFDKKYNKGYKRLLFAASILVYLYFGLLSEYHDLGNHKKFMQYIDICFAALALLAFVPHNLMPYNFHRIVPSLQRLIHNLLAIVAMVSVPGLIITYQVAIIHNMRFLGIAGLVLICIVVVITVMSLVKNGVNGSTELLFINGISIWIMFVTVVIFLH